MKTATLLASLLFSALATQTLAAVISYSEVQPYAEPSPVTVSEKAGVKFKPQLHISNGCHSYPAVNAAGDTGGGLDNTAPSSECEGSSYGSQVYGRSAWYSDRWAIMYAWYFPKGTASSGSSSGSGHGHDWQYAVVWIDNPDVENPAILGVSASSLDGCAKYTNPAANNVDGTSVLINYDSKGSLGHELSLTDQGGDYQPLIMWDQLTDEARNALGFTDFGSAQVPMSDFWFKTKLKRCWPF